MRLAVLTSHPIQYYAPLFAHLATRLDLHVFFAHQPSAQQQADAGFGTAFNWDVDLTSGYSHSFLKNVAKAPDATRFSGCDTPEIGDRLAEGKFDAVLTLGWHLKSLLQGVWAAKRRGLPVLVRGDSQLSTPRSALKRWGKSVVYPAFLRTFDAALYVGKRSRAYYEHYSYPADRLFSSPHCVDTERFRSAATEEARNTLRSRLGVEPDVFLILFVGKLVPLKRPLDVIEAANALRARGAKAEVMIAGAGELDIAMKEKARQLGVPLHSLGFKNQSEMPSVFAAADVLVLPSSQETWGLVCNEALACGKPIIVSDEVGCAPDLAADGHVGRVYRMGDVDGCVQALASLLAMPPSLAEIAKISSRWTIAAAAEGVLEALARTCRQDRSVTPAPADRSGV